jgi:hypothetical protein
VWHVRGVGPLSIASLAALALAALGLAAAAATAGCKAGPPSAAEVADRAWGAHERVVAAGEQEQTCAAAGAAMQRVFAEHRQAFVDGIKLDRDRARLEQATDYLAEHEGRYRDLEARMDALGAVRRRADGGRRVSDDGEPVAGARGIE